MLMLEVARIIRQAMGIDLFLSCPEHREA
jgi:hypothetical protein